MALGSERPSAFGVAPARPGPADRALGQRVGCRRSEDRATAPVGFVVPAQVYRTFRDDTHLAARLHLLLHGLDVDDCDELRAVAAQAQSALQATRMPEHLAIALRAAYQELGGVDANCPVAVWCPANGESMNFTSPSAPHDKPMIVRGSEQTLGAVKRCWSSIFDARTLYYRGQLEVDLARMETSVVVHRVAG